MTQPRNSLQVDPADINMLINATKQIDSIDFAKIQAILEKHDCSIITIQRLKIAEVFIAGAPVGRLDIVDYILARYGTTIQALQALNIARGLELAAMKGQVAIVDRIFTTPLCLSWFPDTEWLSVDRAFGSAAYYGQDAVMNYFLNAYNSAQERQLLRVDNALIVAIFQGKAAAVNCIIDAYCNREDLDIDMIQQLDIEKALRFAQEHNCKIEAIINKS